MSGEGATRVRELFACRGASPGPISAGRSPSPFSGIVEELLIEMIVLAGLIGMFVVSAAISVTQDFRTNDY